MQNLGESLSLYKMNGQMSPESSQTMYFPESYRFTHMLLQGILVLHWNLCK